MNSASIILLIGLMATMVSGSVVDQQTQSHCGKKLAERVMEVCGDRGCTTDHDVASFACANQVSSEMLRERCCPSATAPSRNSRALEREEGRVEYVVVQPSSRVCGRKLIHRVGRLCPIGCSTDIDVVGLSCGQGVSDTVLQQACCPEFF